MDEAAAYFAKKRMTAGRLFQRDRPQGPQCASSAASRAAVTIAMHGLEKAEVGAACAAVSPLAGRLRPLAGRLWRSAAAEERARRPACSTQRGPSGRRSCNASELRRGARICLQRVRPRSVTRSRRCARCIHPLFDRIEHTLTVGGHRPSPPFALPFRDPDRVSVCLIGGMIDGDIRELTVIPSRNTRERRCRL